MKVELHSLHPAFPPCLRFARGPEHLEAVGPWADRLAALPAPVAIVGTRKPHPEAWRYTHWLSATLAAAGATIVSGGAYGIDSAAHEGALSVSGRTIAVLPSTLDRFMPAGNSELFRRIRDTGALVAIAPDRAKPYYHERNAVIAALAAHVVVIAAGHRSGALVTATAAVRLERPVWVVPGAPWDLSMQGCALQLVRSGTSLVSPEPLARALGLPFSYRTPGKKRSATTPHGRARDLLFDRPWEQAPFDPNPQPSPLSATDESLDAHELLDLDPPGSSRPAGTDPDVTSRRRPASAPTAATNRSLRSNIKTLDSVEIAALDPPERTLHEALARGPATMDELVLRTALPVGPVRTLLLTWTVEGVVREGPAGLFRLSSH